MASNYSVQSDYAIKYKNEEKAIIALEDLARKINFCGEKD